MRMIFLAALVLFAIVAGWASIRTGTFTRRVTRQRVDGGIRLRETKTGLGVILASGQYQFLRETVLGVLERKFGVVTFARHVVMAFRPRPVFRIVKGAMFADATKVLSELEDRMTSIHAEMTAIQDTADKEKRAVTDDESKRIDVLFEAFNATESEVKRRKRIEEVNAKLAEPQRRTVPAAPAAAAPGNELPARHDITGGDRTEAFKGTGGFKAFGEFAKSVCGAVTGARPDPRLQSFLAAAPTTFGNEGTGADGGYLIPPDFRTAMMKKVVGEDSLLARTDQNTTSSNSINIPVDETTPWQNTGGIQAFWEGEGGTYPQSKPALRSVNVRAHKLTALVPVTDEQLEDGPSLEAYLRNKAPDKLNFKVNDAIINGDGQGKPLGILNSGAKVSIPKEVGQATATFVFANLVKMWSRIYDPCRRRGVWLINQDIEPQLFQMAVPGTQAAFPAYMPPGGLSQSPYGTLMGRPVVYTEACQTLGIEGDIIFADLSQYLALMKAGGMRSDVSMHLWFDQGLTAFRFTLRLGGLPWWATPIVRKNGANTLSCIVSLQARP